MINAILNGESITTARAVEIFSSLDGLDVRFMIGRRRGAEVKTEHPMVGYLEYGGWYGKLFVDSETVHPLLFFKNKKGAVYQMGKVFDQHAAFASAAENG